MKWFHRLIGWMRRDKKPDGGLPPHRFARQRKTIAEWRGEEVDTEKLWPEWHRLERRRTRRGCKRHDEMID